MTIAPQPGENPAWPIVSEPARQSQPGETHRVRRSPGGTLWCTCQAFFFSPRAKKRCQHTDDQVAIEERLAIQADGGGNG